MQVYIDLENLLKEKNISKNKVCEACKLQRTQLNNYCDVGTSVISEFYTPLVPKGHDFLQEIGRLEEKRTASNES